ncbi:MAG: hypothetical protein R2867_37035 [Caldilineaceae bacterium]
MNQFDGTLLREGNGYVMRTGFGDLPLAANLRTRLREQAISNTGQAVIGGIRAEDVAVITDGNTIGTTVSGIIDLVEPLAPISLSAWRRAKR